MIEKINDRKRPNLGLYQGADGTYSNPIDCSIKYNGTEMSLLQAFNLMDKRINEQAQIISAQTAQIVQLQSAHNQKLTVINDLDSRLKIIENE